MSLPPFHDANLDIHFQFLFRLNTPRRKNNLTTYFFFFKIFFTSRA